MANLNKVMLIGRLTRDPEEILVRGARNGAKFGFAVNNRKLNQDTQRWEDVPVFLDVEVWNRGENNKQGDRAFETLRKGQQVFLEGHLRMDTWEAKAEQGGGKRNKLVVVVDNFQYLEPRADNGGEGMERAPRMAAAPRQPAAAPAGGYDEYSENSGPAPRGGAGGSGGGDDDIPF
jgi:single-strand DNA-binding protein